MRKLIINLSVLLFIALPITLIGSYTFAYEILINQVEVEEMEEKTIQVTNISNDEPKTKIINKILCDGCYQEKEKVTPYLLKDINTKVNLCDDCLEVFTELEKEEQND